MHDAVEQVQVAIRELTEEAIAPIVLSPESAHGLPSPSNVDSSLPISRSDSHNVLGVEGQTGSCVITQADPTTTPNSAIKKTSESHGPGKAPIDSSRMQRWLCSPTFYTCMTAD